MLDRAAMVARAAVVLVVGLDLAAVVRALIAVAMVSEAAHDDTTSVATYCVRIVTRAAQIRGSFVHTPVAVIVAPVAHFIATHPALRVWVRIAGATIASVLEHVWLGRGVVRGGVRLLAIGVNVRVLCQPRVIYITCTQQTEREGQTRPDPLPQSYLAPHVGEEPK